MAAKSSGIKRTRYENNLPRIRRALMRGPTSMPTAAKRYAASIALTAKRSMKKAPKATNKKKRFGALKQYGKSTKKYQQGKRYYWQKGLYSRPGTPPFWHATGPNPGRRGKASLKLIKFVNMGGKLSYRVGPEYFAQRKKPPVPALHEHGGTVRMRTKGYYDRAGKKIKRPIAYVARYPKRPYMAPAVKAMKPRFLKAINNLAGMQATVRAR